MHSASPGLTAIGRLHQCVLLPGTAGCRGGRWLFDQFELRATTGVARFRSARLASPPRSIAIIRSDTDVRSGGVLDDEDARPVTPGSSNSARALPPALRCRSTARRAGARSVDERGCASHDASAARGQLVLNVAERREPHSSMTLSTRVSTRLPSRRPQEGGGAGVATPRCTESDGDRLVTVSAEKRRPS